MYYISGAVEETESSIRYFGFDVFMVLFTIAISYALYRSLKAQERNWFAIGFAFIALSVFVIMDVVMVMNWLDLL